MPEYRAPGVYVEEVDKGPKSIEGVSTSTAAFLGQTERGPTDPEFVTNFAEFERKFGGFALYSGRERLAGTYLAYAVDGFFHNGGTRAFVGRIESEAMPTAAAVLRANEPGSPTPRLDFGTVDGSATKVLTLTNLADTDITIDTANTEISPSGQFSMAAPSATRLASDESATIEITYTPDAEDEDTAALTVRYVDPERPDDRGNLVVELLGEGGSELATDRKRIEFQDCVVADQGVERVTLSNLALESLSVDADGLTSSLPEFEAEVESADVGVGGSTTLVVRFTPTEVTDYDGTVTIPYEGPSGQVDLVVRVSGSGLAVLVPDADRQLFGRVDGTSDPMSVTFTNRSTEEVTIEGSGIDPGNAFTIVDTGAIPASLGPGEEATVEVTFTPSDESLHSETLNLSYTTPGAGATDASVSLLGHGLVELAPDTQRLGFEPVAFPGSTEVRTVTLTNEGAENLTIQSVTATEDAFEVEDPSETTLAPSDVATVDVAFVPGGVGTATAELQVQYQLENATDPETLVVDLAAEATEGFDVSTSVTFGSVSAVGPGVWGSHVAAYVAAGSLSKPDNPLFKLTLRYWTHAREVTFVRDNGVDHPDAPEPAVEEVYDNLSLEETSSDYFEKRVNSASNLVHVAREGTVTPSKWDVEPVWLAERFPSPVPEVDLDDYRGESTPGERTGFAALEEIDDISIVCVPDEASDAEGLQGLTDEIVTHCTTLKDRFAVLQAREQPGDLKDLEPTVGSARLDSSYAAFYYPWLKVRNPETNIETLVPPGGHVAGIYARSDTERGVHKAPANEVVRGAQALQLSTTKAEQDILNPKGVNCIRNFPGRGIRVWGARTASTDPSWKYVNVRRLFLYLEESIDEGTQWVVFEPNDENLWARVRQTVSNFLTSAWRDGALMGTTADEAFYVRCDRSTMTQDDIDNGRLIVEIGVAPVKPAEFVIFRISQWTGGAEGA